MPVGRITRENRQSLQFTLRVEYGVAPAHRAQVVDVATDTLTIGHLPQQEILITPPAKGCAAAGGDAPSVGIVPSLFLSSRPNQVGLEVPKNDRDPVIPVAQFPERHAVYTHDDVGTAAGADPVDHIRARVLQPQLETHLSPEVRKQANLRLAGKDHPVDALEIDFLRP